MLLSLRDRQWAIYRFVPSLLHLFVLIVHFHGDVTPEVDFLGWEAGLVSFRDEGR